MYCNAQIVPAVDFSMYAGAFYMLDLIKHWTFQFEIVKLVYNLWSFFSNDIDCSLESGQDSRCMTTSLETQKGSQKMCPKKTKWNISAMLLLSQMVFISLQFLLKTMSFFSDALAYLWPIPEHITSTVQNITTIFLHQGFPYDHDQDHPLNISIWVTLSWHVNCRD